MKMRKFWKKALRVRYLILLLAVILVTVIVGLYVNKDLVENKLNPNNMDFTTEGFENYLNKDEPVYNSTTKTWWIGEVDTKIKGSGEIVTEKNGNWWIGETDSGIEASMFVSKKVVENDKYIMFIDEMTTIVTIVDKTSLKVGGDANNPKDYTIKYSSANSDGNGAASKGNFTLSYSSTDIAKPINKEFNVYSQSINYENVLTSLYERHYSIKYLDDAVQIYYTIGNFGSLSSYFPQQFYATIYEPARCYYDNEADYQAALEEYQNDYLVTVGSLDNTFEERFRGNTQINMTPKRDEAAHKIYVSPSKKVIVHSEEAKNYLLNVVLPEMANDGIDVKLYSEEEIQELDDKAVKKFKDKKSKSKYPILEWEIEVPIELVDMYSEYYKKYFNNADSPLTNNPYLNSWDYQTLSTTQYTRTDADYNTIFYDMYTLNVIAGPSAQELYDRLYSNEQKIETEKDLASGQIIEHEYVYLINGVEYPYASSGYVAKDEDGNYIYDENGFITKQLYTANQVNYDNSIFSIETEGLPIFKVAIEFKLTDEGYKITIPNESLIDSTNVTKDDPDYKIINGKYQIVEIKLCPFMTQVNNKQEGYMIIPDGSGAVINFNNGKKGQTVSGVYYGKDNAYVDMVDKGDTTNLLLGMYAFVNTTPENPSGLIAAIEQGGGQFSINAGINPVGENFVHLTAQLRSKESIRTGTASSNTSFDKFDKVIGSCDLVVNYIMVDENNLEYSTIAKIYQDYLIKRDGLEKKDNTNTMLNDLTFLGAFDKYALLFGVKYKTTDTLTTFDQAQEILDELMNNNVNNLSVSYKGWTSENLEYELGGALKVANKLGKTTSMSKFYEYCVQKGVTFYPELSITTAKGYDYSFGSLKYTSRGVGNEESVHYSYDLATGRQDKKLSKVYTLSPLFYKSITEEVISNFQKLNIWTSGQSNQNGGFLLTDLGNQWAGNYRKGSQVYGGEAVLYQQEVLEMLADGNKIKIEAPCDYAFKYVDVATNVPVGSTMYTIYDETIPFYQLVVNGLFDYTTENINGLSNRSSEYYFAKALETGSNLSYMLSAEDPAILLETDYTQYYQAYYQNWKNTIIDFTNKINALNIHACTLTSHEIIKVNNNSLSKVTYTSKTNPSEQIVLLVNVTNKTLNYNGQDIPGYGYIKVN